MHLPCGSTQSAQHYITQVYDHISQGSPNLLSPERETYRRAVAVTAVREGSNDHVPYLYTLNFACPSETWEDMEPMFRKASRPGTLDLLCCMLLHDIPCDMHLEDYLDADHCITQGVSSFRLTALSDGYVGPDQQTWRFF